MSCGCQNQCLCQIEGADGITVVGDGSTDSPYIITPPPETVFDASNSDGTILITPGGPDGHEPVIDIVIDPASTAPISKSISGLRIDCCDPGAIVADEIPGVVKSYAGSTAPAGYLFCDGSSVAVATYPDLFAIIGYTFGGAGANFNLPDLRGRVDPGPDNMGTGAAGRITANNALGNTAGLQTHTLTSAQMPVHTHGPGTYQLTPAIASGTPSAYTAPSLMGVGPTPAFGVITTAAPNIATGVSSATGGGGSHNNLQPYLILNKIIKT